MPRYLPETPEHRRDTIRKWASRKYARELDAIRVRAFRKLDAFATDEDVDRAYQGTGWRQNPPIPTLGERLKGVLGRLKGPKK